MVSVVSAWNNGRIGTLNVCGSEEPSQGNINLVLFMVSMEVPSLPVCLVPEGSEILRVSLTVSTVRTLLERQKSILTLVFHCLLFSS